MVGALPVSMRESVLGTMSRRRRDRWTASRGVRQAAVFTSRSDFIAAVQPGALFAGARQIRAAGLSLNLICQQVAEQQVRQMINGGTGLSTLFLDPSGTAIKAREQEEEYTPGHLISLTQLNIDIMIRLRDRLPEEFRDRLRIAVYDETIRFNLILVDDDTRVAQPYLPTALLDEAVHALRANTDEYGFITSRVMDGQQARRMGLHTIGYARTQEDAQLLSRSGTKSVLLSLADLTLRLRARPLAR